ncbi:hypothetical protein, partial [Ruminococcus sp.]|uniref:hypothetical protein n=1 Tax=Ruminococcus sp. TaxID=41978 RepID=UPI003FD83042
KIIFVGSICYPNIYYRAFFSYCSRKCFRLFVQAAELQAVWLSSDCVNGKYLWALPKPAIFEKIE